MRDVETRATAEGRSLKAIMTEALQLGLHRKAGTHHRFTVTTYPLGGQRLDYTKAWSVVDGLEADAVAENLGRRK